MTAEGHEAEELQRRQAVLPQAGMRSDAARTSSDTLDWMHTRRHYAHAPITEAVIDFRVRASGSATLEALAALQGREAARYPTRQDRMLFETEARGGTEVGAIARQSRIGYMFISSDGLQIFQARLDGFALSRLAPYEHWETFRAEAQRLWELYRSAVTPDAVTRVAVRYVNRLDLPLPVADLKDYLRTVPEVSPDLPQALGSYIMQLQIPRPEIEAMLIINQALLPNPSPGTAAVLLDIDVFKEVQLSHEEAGIWSVLDLLHGREGEAFEACITDRTREVIA